MTSKLFVVGFPREMTETTLLEMFSMHGNVIALNIVKDKAGGFSSGYGFVEMSDEADAGRAIAALHELQIGERTISVHHADKRPVFEITTPKKKRPRRQIS